LLGSQHPEMGFTKYPNSKTVAVIQARMSSTRLPGKVLRALPLGSQETVLDQVLKRVKRAAVDQVVVATSEAPDDNAIAEHCASQGVGCFRGDLNNVLERFYKTSYFYQAKNIVRITADCPCLDSAVINAVLGLFHKESVDYASNSVVRSYPRGLDVEVFSFDALTKAYCKAQEGFEREHVTPYLYLASESKGLKMVQLEAQKEDFDPELRLTLDTPEDYAFLCAVFVELYSTNQAFNWKDVQLLMKKKPWLRLINENTKQKELLKK
jgi:spore coat polysaccharide biosynthesis protein SpsF